LIRKAFVLIAALALLGAACGSSDNESDSGGDGGSSSNAVTVEVDGKAEGFHAGFLAYFPKAVTVHAGDTVDFHNNYSGEPHTVTFGTLADAALAASEGADENGPPPDAVAKMPQLLPEGPGDTDPAAANECLIATGSLPLSGDDCDATDTAFDGKQAFYNSGFLAPDVEDWKLELADDIAPGTYGYYCLLHGTHMSGTIEVVADDTDIPSADEVAATATEERDAGIAKVKDALAALPKGELPPFITATPGQVLAGSGAEDPTAPAILDFGPKEVSIPVGGSVTWIFVGPHTVSFNAPKDAYNALTKGDDGKFHVNAKLVAPSGSPEVAPADENAPPGPPKITDGGSWDGSGFLNTGAVLSFPPSLLGYKLTFTKAGTYGYVCLVHPGMTGTVKVG
jgi:plastocyanin